MFVGSPVPKQGTHTWSQGPEERKDDAMLLTILGTPQNE